MKYLLPLFVLSYVGMSVGEQEWTVSHAIEPLGPFKLGDAQEISTTDHQDSNEAIPW